MRVFLSVVMAENRKSCMFEAMRDSVPVEIVLGNTGVFLMLCGACCRPIRLSVFIWLSTRKDIGGCVSAIDSLESRWTHPCLLTVMKLAELQFLLVLW